jgi:hypothetical protein
MGADLFYGLLVGVKREELPDDIDVEESGLTKTAVGIPLEALENTRELAEEELPEPQEFVGLSMGLVLDWEAEDPTFQYVELDKLETMKKTVEERLQELGINKPVRLFLLMDVL